MSTDIGFDAQVPSLPQGGGAVSGLGETFTPDLSTGTGTYDVRLDLPNGPNDIGPRLSLRYDTASGNGPFGMGFSIPMARLLRSTATGFPQYTTSDSLMLEGAGELLATGAGTFRPRVDGGAWRAEVSGDGFRLTDREGIHYFVGLSPATRLSDSAPGASKVYAWHLERIEDALGNSVAVNWIRDRDQLYLSRLTYGAYEVRFNYGPRPDVIRWGRGGFPITTALRCESIELHLLSDIQPLLRRWTLSYTQDPANNASLLTAVTLSGFDENNGSLSAPPLRLGYTRFQPAALTRFSSRDESIGPGPLVRSDKHVELVDWNGDGLPDLLEIAAGGRGRLWPNAGNCTWGYPQMVADLPLFASPTAAVAFADVNGDGSADLLRTDRPLEGFIPHIPGGGFARPVSWRQAPAVSLGSPNARLVDLDGDGLADLLVSSAEYLSLYYRSDPDGWSERPQVVPRGSAPDVNLSDPHVFIADLTGDGTQDIVRVLGGSVTYWPYLGNGKWDEPVLMNNGPALPFDVVPQRLFFSDIDGDGCADLLYLDEGSVRYWINQAGNSFSEMRTINFVPTGQIGEARLADMRGSGTAGLLWSTMGPFQRGCQYFYLDFSSGPKPYLLNTIDNGVGLATEISYTTSASAALEDAAAGRLWSTFLPISIPLVAATSARDVTTGRSRVTRFHYHNGRYDGIVREFAGFGRVDEDQIGDDTSPTQRTTTWFHIGIEPTQPEATLTAEDRLRLRAIRGRIHRQELYGLDGSPQQDAPYSRLEQEWTVSRVDTAGGPVYVPRLVSNTRTNLERAAAAASVITTRNLARDSNENITESVQTSEVPGDLTQTLTLRTETSFATDPGGRFVAKPFRVRQLDGAGALVADAITHYDGAPEGTVGALGLVTRRLCLVLSDALATEVYGPALPDFAALGYFRRPGETGWWINQAIYERTDDAAGLRGRVTGARSAVTTIEFDDRKTYPVRITDARGNVIQADHDYRVSRIRQLTDASGASYLAAYDALARPIAAVDPGDTNALPTASYSYDSANLPIVARQQRRAVSGLTQTIDSREIFDGSGKLLERRLVDETGEIICVSQIYSDRGFLARTFLERRAPSLAYVLPTDALAHTAFAYDALGRPIRQQNPDGSTRLFNYHSLFIDEFDEEDTRTGSPHAGTETRKTFDPTGRVRSVKQNLGGRLLTSSYFYDLKGNLLRHTDAMGNTVSFMFDLLGHALRVDRPEQTTISVFDAAGNAVEARSPAGTLVLREFDENNRATAVRFNNAASAPVIRFAYHDNGFPAPPEASVNTVGHLVRVDDESGSTIFDYDQRGRVVLKRLRPTGMDRSFEVAAEYRSDGQFSSLTYPNGGAGRRRVTYEYDALGRVVRIPSVISAIEYELDGQRRRTSYVNGTEQTCVYHDTNRRLRIMELNGPSGLLRSTQYTTDLVGNLLRVDSPDPALRATYSYDDLYQLSTAVFDSGETWNYAYDDCGNITHKSDVGDYRYGENAAPATCLTSAGAQVYTYTALGEMENTPWGIQTFNQMGRLTRIERAGGEGRIDFSYDYTGTRVVTRSTGSVTPAVDRLTPDPLFSIEAGALVLNFFDGQAIVARQTEENDTLFLHTDHLGSLVLVTDAAGQPVERIRYDPYGAILERSGTPTETPIGFTGGTPDPSTGLLYLNARYYNPQLGRFISPDSVVQNGLDPVAWSPYVYCRNNPTSFIDPTGHGFWGIFLAAIAIVALVIVVAVSFGTLAPVLAVIAGLVIGGLVGGLSAAAHGGDWEDIITGVLVGAAVGGWGALGGMVLGGAVSGLIGQGFVSAVASGAVSGAVNGAAMGFAAGYAGGKGGLEEIWTKVWQGALVGMITGAVVGGISHFLKPSGTAVQETRGRIREFTESHVPDPTDLPTRPLVEPATSGGYAEAASTVIGKGSSHAFGPLIKEGIAIAINSPIGKTIIVDVAAGAWDLGYIPWIFNKIGVQSLGGKI